MSNLQRFGSNWGGWLINPSKIRDNSTILSLGLAHDFSFDEAMIALNPTINIIGVDPTPIAKSTYNNIKHKLDNRFKLIEKAVTGNDTLTVSLGGPAVTCFYEGGVEYPAISINELLDTYKNVCLLKVDIEGSEYEVFESLTTLSVDQICVEWHHWLNKEGDAHPDSKVKNPYTLEDTKNLIKKIQSLGYEIVHQSTNDPKRIIQENLFIRKDLL